jgi:hypothetical protein
MRFNKSEIPYTTAVPKRGVDIFYHCLICDEYVDSVSMENANCRCGNVGVDADYYRVAIWDESKTMVAKQITPRKRRRT